MKRIEPKYRISVGGWHLLAQNMAFGNPTEGGFSSMRDALGAVGALNRVLKTEHNLEISVSAHLNHELAVDIDDENVGFMARHNSNRSIPLDEWITAYRIGKYPPIGRIIPPGFGYPWSDRGAFINPVEEIRERTKLMMVHAFQLSEKVKAGSAGFGEVIYWTGPDGIRWERLVNGDDPVLSYENNQELDEYKKIIEGVSSAIMMARDLGYNSRLLLEGKAGGDPCYLDAMTDTRLEIVAINKINSLIGEKVVEWQGETAHVRGGGETFANGLQMAINGGVFNGAIHLNSGGIASQKFSDLLSVGTKMSLFQQYVDPDYQPGQGVTEWLEDQSNALLVGALWAGKKEDRVFQIEFDARFSRDKDTIGALKKSIDWTVREMQKHGAVPV
jgi:hypothetical protein